MELWRSNAGSKATPNQLFKLVNGKQNVAQLVEELDLSFGEQMVK